MSEAVQEYRQGDQNIADQIATFSLFGKMMKWGPLVLASLLITLVLWFCVDAGFFGGVIPGIVVLALGIYFLRSKPTTGH
ncbi:MAG: aa3-type cytochrome c oxidase subunit IV [Caulobacteraceae bacterium]